MQADEREGASPPKRRGGLLVGYGVQVRVAKSMTNPEQTQTDRSSVEDASQAEDVSQTVDNELDELDASLSDMTSMLLDDSDDDDFDFGGGFDDPLEGVSQSPDPVEDVAQEEQLHDPTAIGEDPVDASARSGEDEETAVESDRASEPVAGPVDAGVAEAAAEASAETDGPETDGPEAEAEAVTDAMQAAAQTLEQAQETGDDEVSAQAPTAEVSSEHDASADVQPQDATDNAGADQDVAENETGDVDADDTADAAQHEAAEAMQAAAQMVEEPSEQSDATSQAATDTHTDETQVETQAQAPVDAQATDEDGLDGDELHDEIIDGGAQVPEASAQDAVATERQVEATASTSTESTKAAKRSPVVAAGEMVSLFMRRMWTMAGPIMGKGAPLLARAIEPVAERFAAQPKVVRQSISWLAMVTAFNAVAVWSFLLFFRSADRGVVPKQGNQIVLPDGSEGAANPAVGEGGTLEPGSAAHTAVSQTAGTDKIAGKP